jgi:hypothetical protein
MVNCWSAFAKVDEGSKATARRWWILILMPIFFLLFFFSGWFLGWVLGGGELIKYAFWLNLASLVRD